MLEFAAPKPSPVSSVNPAFLIACAAVAGTVPAAMLMKGLPALQRKPMPVHMAPVDALPEGSLSSGEPFGPDRASKMIGGPAAGFAPVLFAAESPGSPA